MPKWTDMQLKALTESGNLLISASAGSGKTTVMVQKIIDYLLGSPDADISRLVVITFTRAIAEEMKQKLTEKLYESLRKSACEAERERIRKQINGIPLSYISTIDSFCAEIFRRYFEVINKDPHVSILEESEEGIMFAEAREEVLERYLASGDRRFSDLVERFTAKRDIDRLRKALDDIYKFMSVQADADKFIEKALAMLGEEAEGSEATRYILSHYRRKASWYISLCSDAICLAENYMSDKEGPFGKFRGILGNLLKLLERIASATHIRDLFGITLPEDRAPSARNSFTDDERDVFEEIKKARYACKEFVEIVRDTFEGDYDAVIAAERGTRAAASTLFEVAKEVIKEYQKAKDREKKADFADIEHYCLEILKNDAVAEELRNSIDSIFIDEYQDTNYLQESIIARISKDNVFMVGDVKQSIYRFRFAEPAIFLEKREHYDKTREGLNINFNENFRSTEEVLSFINLVFDEIMVYDLGGIDYKKDARLVYGPEKKIEKKNHLPHAEIAWFKGAKADEPEYPMYYSVREGPRVKPKPSPEAAYIADRIESAVGKAYIYDNKAESYRLCKYSDIAILVRARSCATDIIAELNRRNIPFEAEGFEDGGDGAAIDTLMCFAKVLDNPRQDIPLAAVMLSYLGKFTDKELLEIRANHPKDCFWEAVNAYSGDKVIENKLLSFTNLLQKYRRLAAFLNMRELFDRLIAETGYDGYLLSKGESGIRKLNAFIFSLSGKESASNLRSFVKLCGSERQTLLPTEAEDCVTITTIHRSKGLEYPIVFLPRADYDSNNSPKDSIVMDDNTGSVIKKKKPFSGGDMIALDSKLGIAVMHIDEEGRRAETLSTIALKLKQKNEQKAELIRLLYVAMTRARQHLFISGEEPSKSYNFADEPSTFAQWIKFAIDRRKALERYVVRPAPSTAPVEREKFVYVPKEARAEKINKEYPHIEATRLSIKYSVSALAAAEADETPVFRLDFGGSEDRATIGTVYHAILQHADFSRNTPLEADAQIEELLVAGKIPPLPEGFDREPIYKALANPEFAEIFKCRCLREQPFMLYLPAREVLDTQSEEKVLVQGVIDLLSLGERNIIVDYKFTSAPAETVRERYKKQLDIYATAAEKAFGIRVDAREIYIIGRDEFILA